MLKISNLRWIVFSMLLVVSFLALSNCTSSVTKEEVIPTMIITTPDSLTFHAPFGGPSPQHFLIHVSSSITKEVNFSFENKKGWIDLQNPFFTGVTPDSFLVVFRVAVPSTISAGVHYDTISISSDNALNPLEEFEIKLIIGTELTIRDEKLSFLASYKGQNPEDQYFKIRSTAGNEIGYNTSNSSNWLNLSQASGITSDDDSLVVMIDISTLEPDVYEDTIWVASDSALNSPYPLPIDLTVSSWVSQTSPILEDINSFYFVDAQNGWAVGKSSDLGSFSGYIIKTTDGGKNWGLNKFLSAPPTDDSTLGIIQFVDGVGWTAGAKSILLKTTDNGDNWEYIDLPAGPTNNNTINIFSLYFVSADTGWVTGEDGLVLKTVDGGFSWIEQDSKITQPIRFVYFQDSQKGWGVGAINNVIYTEDGGNNWVVQTVPNSDLVGINYDFKGVSFMDENNGVAIGKLGQIIKTSNGGATWVNHSLPKLVNLSSIQFVSPTTGWIVGQGGTIFKTTDGAQTWSEQFSGTENWLFALYFFDQNIGWVGGEDGVIRFSASGGN